MIGLPTPAALVRTRTLAIVSMISILALCLAAPASSEAKRSARLDRQEAKIVQLVNLIRGDRGLRGLKVSRSLNRAANVHTWDMMVANYFSHTSRNGTSSGTRVRRYRRARTVGETIAYVSRSQRRGAAWRVVNMWMNSPSHRRVLLTRKFRRIGVARQTGRFSGRRAILFTADFTSRR